MHDIAFISDHFYKTGNEKVITQTAACVGSISNCYHITCALLIYTCLSQKCTLFYLRTSLLVLKDTYKHKKSASHTHAPTLPTYIINAHA